MQIAKVVVLVNTGELQQCFDYLIPVEFQPFIVVGAKITVPFAHRPAHGYIIEVTDHSEITQLKAIIDLEPEELWLYPQQLKLAQWMADYYLTPLPLILDTMVPAGFQGSYRLYYFLAEPSLTADNLTPDSRRVLKLLSQKAKPVSRQELLAAFGSKIIANLNELTTAGYIVKQHRLSQRTAKSKQVKAYRLAQSEAGLLNLTPTQQKVVAFLQEFDAPTPYREIYQATGVSRSVVNTLVEKGVLYTEELIVARRPLESKSQRSTNVWELSPDQTKVIAAIKADLDQRQFKEHLIYGITGSGKTEIYKQAVGKCLQLGRSALVLVPEISLTPQMAAEFCQAFGDEVAILHSRLSTGERFDEWNRVRQGQAKVVLGARSAIFAPLQHLGLIVVDEEHESSYKQGETPYYHGVKVAEALAKQEQAVLVLGSATPDLGSYRRALSGKMVLHHLPQRVGGGVLPKVKVCDMRVELKTGNRSIFSRDLQQALSRVLAQKEQAILFLNRRGYASFVLCRSCGHVIKCQNCQVSLTVHKARPRLSCHYCGWESPLPETCPACQSSYIRDFGIGTQRVEQEVQRHFPQARVARLDSDTTVRKGATSKILAAFRQGNLDLLVGTQMVAKGLDFPNVTVVGVIAADISLNLPDFRSAERTFQLVSQVSGRAGRGRKPGSVIIQTYNPDHYSIQAAANHDYFAFAQAELAFRESLNYPPFYDMVLIVISSTVENEALQAGKDLEERLRAALSKECLISPIHPAPLAKLRNRFRFQIGLRWPVGRFTVREADKKIVYDLCSALPTTKTADIRVNIDVDPVSLL